MDELAQRIVAANAALAIFADGTTIERRRGGMYVLWTGHRGQAYARRWQCQGQDWYPVWKNSWGHGGSCCVALSQLVRWAMGKTVLPMSTWEYWAQPQCYLARERGEELVAVLRAAGYPERVPCVLCRGELSRETGMDWWSLAAVVGPCCSMRGGCQQQRTSSTARADFD